MFKSFATVVANAALSFGAGSGIVIVGGVTPRLRGLLDQSGFYERLVITDVGALFSLIYLFTWLLTHMRV